MINFNRMQNLLLENEMIRSRRKPRKINKVSRYRDICTKIPYIHSYSGGWDHAFSELNSNSWSCSDFYSKSYFSIKKCL